MTRLKSWCQRIAQRIGLTGAGAAVFAVAPLVAWVARWNVGNAVVFGTGVVIVVYTYETYQMRRQMVRQTAEMQAQRELQIRPLMAPDPERVSPTTYSFSLRNVGHGAALGIICSVKEVGEEVSVCEPIAVVPAHESKKLIGRTATGATSPLKRPLHLAYDVTITYKNIEGRPYKSRFLVSPDRYELLEP
jgi:hypothetical protein